MIDHRRLQRTLFRAQMDPDFLAELEDGDAHAIASTGLGEAELALLRAAPRAGITADPGGARRLQVLGNATLEYRLSLAVCDDPRARIEGFASSSEFHTAITHDAPLPLAAGVYLQRVLAEQPWPRELARLEHAQVRVRRRPARRPPPPGHWQRAGPTALIELPIGTLDGASAVQAAVASARKPPGPPPAWAARGERETVLLHARPSENDHSLPNAVPECVQGAVAELLRVTETACDADALADFAQRHHATFDDLRPLLDAYTAEGVLLHSP